MMFGGDVRSNPCRDPDGAVRPASEPNPYPMQRTVSSKPCLLSLRVTYEKIGTIQRRLAWPLHKDDTLFRVDALRSTIFIAFLSKTSPVLRFLFFFLTLIIRTN
jgi:hypothetical protein